MVACRCIQRDWTNIYTNSIYPFPRSDKHILNKGRRQKKVVLLGGAHHKVAYPPTPLVVVKVPLFVGIFLFA